MELPGKQKLRPVLFLIIVSASGFVWFLYCHMQYQALNSALITAIEHKNVSRAIVLLKEGADPNARKEGRPLEAEVSRSIWQKFHDFVKGIQPRYKQGGPPSLPVLCLAMEISPPTNLEMGTILLDRGADINAQSSVGVTALMEAADNGDLAAVRMLLTRGANPNIRAWSGNTALRLAQYRQALEIVSLLKQAGAKE